MLDTPSIEAKIEQKVNQKLREMSKKELLSPFIRSKKMLDEEYQVCTFLLAPYLFLFLILIITILIITMQIN